MNWRNVLVTIVLGLLILAAVMIAWPDHPIRFNQHAAGCADENASRVKPEQGYCAPNFTLPNMAGEEVELYDNGGKPTLINFWATWCSPCKVEMPYFESAYQQYGDRVNFMMINQAGTEIQEQNVTKYLEKYKYSFPVLIDRRETNVGFEQYQLIGIPVTIMVDEQGKIIFKRVGSMDEQELNDLLKQAI